MNDLLIGMDFRLSTERLERTKTLLEDLQICKKEDISKDLKEMYGTPRIETKLEQEKKSPYRMILLLPGHSEVVHETISYARGIE